MYLAFSHIWNRSGIHFDIKMGQNRVPRVEKSTFYQNRRKITKIDETCTAFYGEFESEARFAINLKKRDETIRKIIKITAKMCKSQR